MKVFKKIRRDDKLSFSQDVISWLADLQMLLILLHEKTSLRPDNSAVLLSPSEQ